ncbi:serine/threonine-protein kinase [Streptomyces sp. JH010]|uniref:serine/threonine-protein kinase n=1 Tax=Streptomyces TaxID=1883 RepID=UPI0023F8C9DB|nr:serine/threonine-protein kinase [Streptomyces sp. JH010]MDF6066761.1 serine/threonine-protein kinase [Streptomyces sp. JH010]
MTEKDPANPWTGELTTADLERLGAQPLRRSDPVAIGPYRVLARLGVGGMGRLFLGREAAIDADGSAAYGADSLVAVKVIRPEHAEDPRFRRRFEREIEAVRRVHGRYTAGLLDSGFDDEEEQLWMATAYVPGLSLDEAVRRFGPLPAPVVWRLAGEIGEALATIAATGIVHRDLKPSNVLLGDDGARVIDFGVAHTADTSVLTMTGQQVGTPAYMSPEQADGNEAGTPSDVFSLGSVLAYAATGSAPFGEGATVDVMHRVVHSPPDGPVLGKLAEVDHALADLVGRCLDKSPQARPTPQELADAAWEHAPAREWPSALAETVAARAQWSGRAAAVSPMDQLTIVRRGQPQRTVKEEAAPRYRRGLALGVAAAVAVIAIAAAAFVFVQPGKEDASNDAQPVTSSTASSAGSRSASPAKPSASHSAPPSPSPSPPEKSAAPAPPGNDETLPAPPPQPLPTQVTTITATPTSAPKPSASPQPWKSCRYYSGTALTQYGDKGDRVRQVQCILMARGYDIGAGGVDGDFGVDTRDAVKTFQRDRNLNVDGQVGEDTWPALRG